jgi:hypothetical protein
MVCGSSVGVHTLLRLLLLLLLPTLCAARPLPLLCLRPVEARQLQLSTQHGCRTLLLRQLLCPHHVHHRVFLIRRHLSRYQGWWVEGAQPLLRQLRVTARCCCCCRHCCWCILSLLLPSRDTGGCWSCCRSQ